MTTGTSLVCDGGVHHIKPSSSSSSRPLVYSSSSDSLDAPARSYSRTMDRRFMQLESQLTAALRNHRRHRGAAPVHDAAATSTSLCSAAKSDDPPPLQSSRPPATSPKLHGSGSRVEHVARSSAALVSLAESTPDAAVLQTDAEATTTSTTAASSSSPSSSSCCCSSSSSASSSSTSVDSSTDKRDSRPTSEQSVPRRHSAGITPGDQHVPSTSSSSSSSSAGLKLSSFFHTN